MPVRVWLRAPRTSTRFSSVDDRHGAGSIVEGRHPSRIEAVRKDLIRKRTAGFERAYVRSGPVDASETLPALIVIEPEMVRSGIDCSAAGQQRVRLGRA